MASRSATSRCRRGRSKRVNLLLDRSPFRLGMRTRSAQAAPRSAGVSPSASTGAAGEGVEVSLRVSTRLQGPGVVRSETRESPSLVQELGNGVRWMTPTSYERSGIRSRREQPKKCSKFALRRKSAKQPWQLPRMAQDRWSVALNMQPAGIARSDIGSFRKGQVRPGGGNRFASHAGRPTHPFVR